MIATLRSLFFIRALFSESSNSFLSGIVQIGCIHNRQTRVSDNLLGIINVSSFKTNNQRDLQLDTFAGVDDTIGDGGAVNDSTKNIDENGFNFWIFRDDAEGFLYLRLLHVAPYIEEVSWFPSVQFNDVHGGHRQPSSIDQASNVSFKLNVVKIVTCCINFPRIRLRGVLHVEDCLLSE